MCYFALMNTPLTWPRWEPDGRGVSPALCPRDAALWTARRGAAPPGSPPVQLLSPWADKACGRQREVGGEPLRQRDPAPLSLGVCTRDVAHAALEQLSKYAGLTRRRAASTRAHRVSLPCQLMEPFAEIKGAARGVKSPCDPVCVRSLLADLRLQAEINLELFGPRRVTPGASTLSELVAGRGPVRWSHSHQGSNSGSRSKV